MNLVEKSKLISLLNRVLKQTGKQTGDNEITFVCPFHRAIHQIHRKKFGITFDGQYNCFACGESGKSFKTLFKKLKVSKSLYTELYKIIGDDFRPNREKKTKEKQSVLKLPDEFLPLYIPRNNPEYKRALNFLIKRNVTKDDILRYNIGYCEEGMYINRIIIPSYDKNGDLNFFSARDFLGNSKYKYLLPKWSKDIIGLELLINWNEDINLVEGIFDAIAIRNNVIPLFGKTLSFSLKEALLEHDVKRVNICLDNDALKNSIKIANYLCKFEGVDVYIVKLEKKDPSEIGFEGMQDLINNSKKFDFSELISLKMSL